VPFSLTLSPGKCGKKEDLPGEERKIAQRRSNAEGETRERDKEPAGVLSFFLTREREREK
jgi:hypothetical protein